MIQGHPGLGKSLLAIDAVARVTTGTPFPFCDGMLSVPKGEAIILSAEDDARTTLRPRLDAAGADPNRWAIVESKGFFSIAKDSEWLAGQMETRPDLRLIVIDPISAYYGDGIDDNRNAQIRSHLAPLILWAAKYEVALWSVNHLNKQHGQLAMMRGLGSVGLVAAARVAYLVSKDPTKGGQNRLMMPVKMNLAKESELDGMAFEVVEASNGHPRIEWQGRVAMTADQALAAADNIDGTSKLEEAVALIEAAVANGPIDAEAMEQSRKEEGVSLASFKRARKLCPQLRYRQKRDGQGRVVGGEWWQEAEPIETLEPASQTHTHIYETMGLYMCEGGSVAQIETLEEPSGSRGGVCPDGPLAALHHRLGKAKAAG